MAKKRAAAPRKKKDAGLREDVREAIERVWPHGVVDMDFDSEDSYFWDVYPKLAKAFARIKGTRLVHEREPKDELDRSDFDEDLPDDIEYSRSYHLFFLSPEGEAFTYETEIEPLGEPEFEDGELEEDDFEDDFEDEFTEETIPGRARTGWSVAVSLLAPFAVITLDEMAIFEDGSTRQPGIESHAFTEEGERVDPEEHFQKSRGQVAFEVLLKLRGRIVDLLGKHGISVLPKEEWQKPVPWLRGGEEAFVGTAGEPVRVLDAFFFEGL
jgi:hypothetical protein